MEPQDFILRDPVGAHLYYFPHRHPRVSPGFHEDLILDIHNLAIEKLIALIFRGGAKSTLLEEAMTLRSAARLFHFGIVIGDSETRAIDRLTAIKYELVTNDRLIEDFGPQRGEEWTNSRVVLQSGACLQAFGRNQSIRGIKYLDSRPDFMFLDDIESRDSVGTTEAIEKTMRWLTSDVLPARGEHYLLRIAATPLHPNAACVQLSRNPSFITRRCPIYYYHYPDTELTPGSDEATPTPGTEGGSGEQTGWDSYSTPIPQDMSNSVGPKEGGEQAYLVSAWPDKFPLEESLALREEYERMGMLSEFGQEYLVEAELEETRTFNVTTFAVDSTLRHTFQPTYIICDPARTTKQSSSLSGFVVVSFEGSRLIVWESFGLALRPDEIITTLFSLATKYDPVHVAVERDGLEEFILQPIRLQSMASGHALPLLPLKAPKDKLSFIKSLQPFISAGDIVLSGHQPVLEGQLKNFPQGKIDVLNALAYAPTLRPGTPVYQGFDPIANILAEAAEELPKQWPCIFALNSSRVETAGAVLTMLRRKIVIIADCVVDGPPSSSAVTCLTHLRMATSRTGNIILPKHHFQGADSIGLRAAMYSSGQNVGQGGDPSKARAEVQSRIDSRSLLVSDTAKWTLRAITSGYAFPNKLPGQPPPNEPVKNQYRVLMEAIEGAIQVVFGSFEDTSAIQEIDPRTGRKYFSSRPGVRRGR